jgi:hypothetical protein
MAMKTAVLTHARSLVRLVACLGVLFGSLLVARHVHATGGCACPSQLDGCPLTGASVENGRLVCSYGGGDCLGVAECDLNQGNSSVQPGPVTRRAGRPLSDRSQR